MYKNHPIYFKYGANCFGEIVGPRGHKLKPIEHHTGYNVLTVDYKQYRWHRFVWECFNGVIEDDSLVINHKDGDKRNNSISNLELVTHKENTEHAFSNGLRKGMDSEKARHAKLTKDSCQNLIQRILEGRTNSEVAEEFNLHPRYVSLIRHKRRWRRLWEEMEI